MNNNPINPRSFWSMNGAHKIIHGDILYKNKKDNYFKPKTKKDNYFR